MPDLFDLLNTLGRVAAAPPAGPAGPALAAMTPLARPALDRLAQFADVPGPPQDLGQLLERLGQVAGGANNLGTAAGTMAFAPLLAREYQIANSPNFAGNPVPGVSGLAANALAAPSMLPGGVQAAQALGIPPPVVSHGDITGAAYAASAAQGGGLAGLGAALDKLAEMQHAVPEVIPGQKFAAENILNPLTYLGGAKGVQAMGGPAGALVGAPAAALGELFNLPLQGARMAWQSPLAQRLGGAALSGYSKGVLQRRFGEDTLRGLQAQLDAAGMQSPAILGTEARDPRLQAASVLKAVSAPPAEDAALLAENAAKAADASAAAQDALRTQIVGEAPVAGAAPSAVSGAAEAAGAVPAAGPLTLDTLIGDKPLRWYNNRAEATYKLAQTAFAKATGNPSPPATDIPLASTGAILAPREEAESWLAGVLGNIQKEGVRPGRVLEQTAEATRRASYQRGLGGAVGGQTSARTGDLIFEPDTIGQVDFAMKRLQDRGLLPAGDAPRLAVDLRWAEDVYGPTFPAPPSGEQPFWAAIQAHMDRARGVPPGAAPEAAGTATEAAAAAAPTPPEGSTPSGGAPSSPAGAAAESSLLSTPPAAPAGPTAGEALAGPEARVTPGAPAGTGPAASAVVDDAALQAREQFLQREINRLTVDNPAAAVPDVVVDPLRAELAAVRQQRIGPPTSNPVTPPESFAPPSAMPEGPLGGMADVPPEPFTPGTTARTNPAAAQELADAQKAEQIARAESDNPAEIAAAIQRRKDAEAAVQQDYASALPADFGLSAERAQQLAVGRQALGEVVQPGQMDRALSFGRQIGTALDKLVPDLESMQALRTEVGLGADAGMREVLQALKDRGSAGAGVAAEIQGRWKGDILTGDLNHILTEHTLADYAKAHNLDLDRFGGPQFIKDLSAAWRAQALFSPAFHVKNVADAVIRSFVDAGKPGFLADAQPWNPRDLGNLIQRAWTESGTHDPNAVLSPQLRVWSAIHDLPISNEMFAAPNPTLQQALDALWPAQRAQVLAGLSPVERALMEQSATLAVPTAIAEAAGPAGAGGWLSKVPGVNRTAEFNLKLTMGIEQSARAAKFIDAYADGIAQGLPKAEAYQQGISEANRLFFDYQGDLSNLDRIARNAFAFHVFATRNLQFWAPILASNPILIKALAGYDEWTNQMAAEGGYAANRRFAESVKVPLIGGVGGKLAEMLFGRQGQLFWNPLAYLAIAEQTLTTPQEYRDESPLGIGLNKARSVGLGLAPWADLPLTALGAYGSRGPQSLTSLDPLVNAGAQTVLGRPTELPWQTAQRFRLPGQATPASLDVAVRQRLGEMSLERRPDYVQQSPMQPIAPEFVRAMAEGPSNALYQEAARSLGVERLAGTVAGKLVGGSPAFQSQGSALMAAAEGNAPRGGTPQDRARYQRTQQALLPPEALPLLGARHEIMTKNPNEPGSQPAGEPEETKGAWVATHWRTLSPARQMALLQIANADPEWRDAISKYLAGRARQGVNAR